MSDLPLFPVTTVGTWPRPRSLLRAQKQKRKGEIGQEEFDSLADEAVRDVLALQEEAGVDLVTDGEQRRDNFFSFVAEKLDGVELMTLGEMLEIVEDKESFEQILQTLDVPAYAISNATCVGPIEQVRPLALDELLFTQRHTDRPVKVPLPGPYLLTRAMFVPEVTRPHYETKEEMGEVVVDLLRSEIQRLVDAGAAFIQLDEPVLTELVFTKGQTRTFMCAALAAKEDPTDELEFAVDLMNRVVEGLDGARLGVHVCRGNWSPDESILLEGEYHPLVPYLDEMEVDQLVLEYSTDRAGDLIEYPGKEIGYGVLNPRTPEVESREEIGERIDGALELYDPDRIFLNPDCGFATFSARPVNDREVAFEKMKRLADVARSYR